MLFESLHDVSSRVLFVLSVQIRMFDDADILTFEKILQIHALVLLFVISLVLALVGVFVNYSAYLHRLKLGSIRVVGA